MSGADGPGVFGSIVLGIVEGLTEFLPVSSTGHLIVANRLLGHDDPTFEIAIQAGAITAIAVLYRQRLWRAARELLRPPDDRRVNLWWLIVIAALPAAVTGLLFERRIEELLFRPSTVATSLCIGGVVLLWLERVMARRASTGAARERELDGMRLRHALGIGLCQTLALIPGTSRSGATIAGALLLGFRRPAAAEFSFLVGLPILYGACLVKVARDWERIAGPLLRDFTIAFGASFVTAALIVGPFVRFLQHHTFRPFAYYRIVAGGVLWAMIGSGLV